MNRNQRRFYMTPQKEVCNGVKQHGSEAEASPPSSKDNIKLMKNRCCYITPDRKSLNEPSESNSIFRKKERLNKLVSSPKKELQELKRLIYEDSNKNPNIRKKERLNKVVSSPKTELQELKRMVCEDSNKVDNTCQFSNNNVEYYDGTEWQIIDDIERFIQGKYGAVVSPSPNTAKAIHISEVPRVKIIAEKYSRYKQNNVELRKLDEKVVCVEYDVYTSEERESRFSKPFQVMRAFFSIRPVHDEDGKTLRGLPSTLRNKFDITFEDLQKLSEKEVEIIDGKIADNLPYLDDLRKILRRKRVVSKNTLDLQTLYELANMECAHFGRNSNFLTKEQLQEVKDLILTKCRSSVYGINRRTVQPSSDNGFENNTVSQSIITELLRADVSK